MTVLIAYKDKEKIILGADKGVFYGDTGFKSNNYDKIVNINDIIIAYTGKVAIFNFLKLFISTKKPEMANEIGMTRFCLDFYKFCSDDLKISTAYNDIYNESSFFIVYQKKLFVYRFGAVSEIKCGFETLGAGFREARTAMSLLNNDVRKSIKKTIEMNIYTSGEVDILEIDIKDNEKGIFVKSKKEYESEYQGMPEFDYASTQEHYVEDNKKLYDHIIKRPDHDFIDEATQAIRWLEKMAKKILGNLYEEKYQLGTDYKKMFWLLKIEKGNVIPILYSDKPIEIENFMKRITLSKKK